MTVEEAHTLAHEVEKALKEAIPGIHSHIHIEPAEPHRRGFFHGPEESRKNET